MTTNTDKARFDRLSPAARRLLSTLEWTRLRGHRQYHGQASAPGAKLELERAHLVEVLWDIEDPARDRLMVKAAGWRLARKFTNL